MFTGIPQRRTTTPGVQLSSDGEPQVPASADKLGRRETEKQMVKTCSRREIRTPQRLDL